MIVFDLQCGGDHVFEAWFASSAAFEEQAATGLVRCPMCDDARVKKAAMAPNIAAKGNRNSVSPDKAKAALAMLAKAQGDMLRSSNWVGTAFADRARAMHAGEEKQSPIHGQATLAEAKALVDEGVPVAPLPLPVVPPEAAN